ncbi:c-type cytochrome [Azohydromonas sediminis]|uniref:c-type cytochrome n=1 Tax=Azohydromonas sediminis TaxID=2259674 RepID=UPI000E659E16|nr:c-type cytochrome [Azohydromonas sediminis]
MNAPHAFRLAAAVLAATLLAPLSATAAGDTKAGPDLAKGRTIATQVCVACHTVDGSRGAPANPILAGQHPEYLTKQLREFKAGKRVNAVMQGMVAALSDDDMVNVAAFYASLPPVPGAATNADLVLLGERIWRGGIASKKVPACAGCHSPNGAGIPAQYPRLAGQHAEYVASSLKGYRSGERANNAQMLSIAANLSDREIAALADYAAGLR